MLRFCKAKQLTVVFIIAARNGRAHEMAREISGLGDVSSQNIINFYEVSDGASNDTPKER